MWCRPYLAAHFGFFDLRTYPWSLSKVQVSAFYPSLSKYVPSALRLYLPALVWSQVFWFFPKLLLFFFLAVLALACISLRTKVLIVLTSLHAVVTMVSLFYFVAVRQLNKPTPEKPNAKINNSDENHVHWCLRVVKDLYRCPTKGVLLAQAGCCRSLLIPLQCRSQKKTSSSCNEIIVTTGGECRDKHCWCLLL